MGNRTSSTTTTEPAQHVPQPISAPIQPPRVPDNHHIKQGKLETLVNSNPNYNLIKAFMESNPTIPFEVPNSEFPSLSNPNIKTLNYFTGNFFCFRRRTKGISSS